jgi:hypothetical protein
MEFYAYIDSSKHYFIRVGGYAIHRTPTIQILLKPPRMEKCFTAGDEFHRIVEAFLKAAENYGGDPIAINLIKEHYTMSKSKHIIVSIALASVLSHHAHATKAAEALAAAGEGHVHIKSKEEFDALPEAVRLSIADTNKDVATLPNDVKLERAYEVAITKPAIEKVAPPARAKGVKSLIRELFTVPGASHSVDDIMSLTGGTKVSVTTALSDLRSPTYCKPGEPLSLTRLPSGKYELIAPEEAEAAKAKIAEEAEAAKAAKKAEAEAAKAAKKAEAEAAKAAKKAEAEAAKAETAQ